MTRGAWNAIKVRFKKELNPELFLRLFKLNLKFLLTTIYSFKKWKNLNGKVHDIYIRQLTDLELLKEINEYEN